MTAPTPDPKNLQVIAPQQQQQQAQQEPAPQKPAPSTSDEEVLLQPEQVENLLRGLPPDGAPEGTEPTTGEREQQQMVQEFFTEVQPAQQQAQPVPGAPPPGTPTSQIPAVQQAMAQAVQEPMAPVQAPPQQVPSQPVQVPQMQPLPQQQQYVAAQGPATVPPHVPGQQPMMPQQPSPEVAAVMAQNAQLSGQVQQLMAQINAMQQAGAAQSGGPPYAGQQPQVPGQEVQPLRFNVPDDYLAALASEDPNQRRAALNGMLNGVANSVAQSVRAEMQQHMQSVPTMIQSHYDRSSMRQQIFNDIYSQYPELRNFEHLVEPTALAVAQETQAQNWSPELRDEVARRLSPMAPGVFQKVQANIASRMTLPQQGMVAQIPQHYAAVQAVPAAQQGVVPPTMLARDAAGNLIPIYQPPQPYQLPAGARPDGGLGVSPQLQDIWRTLDYPTGM